MSLLGFDALGRWALGQFPGNGNFALLTLSRSVALAGQTAAFRVFEPVAAVGFLATGISAGFGVAELAGPGPFAFTGNTAAFRPMQSSLGGSFLLNGAPTNWTVRAVASSGAVLLSGMSLAFFPSLAPGRGAFAWAGGGSTYSRDYEAWVPRPFDSMSWQTEATLPPPNWNGASISAGVWTADAQPANAWTPASIESEPWTTE